MLAKNADYLEGTVVLLLAGLQSSYVHLIIIHEPVELDLLAQGHIYDLGSQGHPWTLDES